MENESLLRRSVITLLLAFTIYWECAVRRSENKEQFLPWGVTAPELGGAGWNAKSRRVP